MLSFLFRRLTGEGASGAALFDALTDEARQPHWFVEGKVADTLDGRFAVVATLVGLTLARLEREGESASRISVALTERFVAVMESEHRELGLGDPTLGKTVLRLVARSLGARTCGARPLPATGSGSRRPAKACTRTRRRRMRSAIPAKR